MKEVSMCFACFKMGWVTGHHLYFPRKRYRKGNPVVPLCHDCHREFNKIVRQTKFFIKDEMCKDFFIDFVLRKRSKPKPKKVKKKKQKKRRQG